MILAQTANEWLTAVVALIAAPYLFSICSLIFALKKKRAVAVGFLIPAGLTSLYLLSGGIGFFSVPPAVICVAALVLF